MAEKKEEVVKKTKAKPFGFENEDIFLIEDTELQHKHQFHFKEFYKMTHDWFEDNAYYGESGGDDYENFYMERHHESGIREVRYWWHMFKTAQAPNSVAFTKDKPFVTFHITFRVRAIGVKDIEVAYGTKKVRLQDGEIAILIRQEMIVNYGALKKHWLGKMLFNFFSRRWYKSYFEQFKKIATVDFFNIQDTCKRWLNWYQYSLVPKPLRPSVGGYRAKSEFEK
jgi:hypothetical protein